jgi:hypothetical protein
MSATRTLTSTRNVRVGFDLYWLRETPAGKMNGQFGVRIPAEIDKTVTITRDPADGARIDIAVADGSRNSSAALRSHLGGSAPLVDRLVNRALRERVFAILPASAHDLPAEIRLAVHIPFAGRRSADRDRLPDPVHDTSGAIYFGDPDRTQCLSLVPGTCSQLAGGDRIPWALRYSATHTLSPSDSLPTVAGSILDRHCTRIDMPETRGQLELTWLLTLDPGAALAWTNLPHPSSADFSRLMRHTMFAVQYALRTFAPYHYFLNLRQFGIRSRSWPMLVYSSMRPVMARAAHKYGYDVLDPAPIASALRWASRPLRNRLQEVHRRLRSAGLDNWHDKYPVCNRGRIIRLMHKLPRYYGLLLTTENRILNVVRLTAEFACEITRTIESGSEVLYAQRRAATLTNHLTRHLDRLYTRHCFGQLAPLVLLAATWGLANGLGAPPKLDLQLRLRETETGAEWAWRRPISYANPRRRRPLHPV